ncbi:peptide ABC transporter substrate-binding protein [Cohnella kolymensis]|uniref:Peptide ABC transporter substrate-binding protein n=1 Tax=Cohnella kolymensis TaxID=1590652 RepID=A0ABR5A6Z1_9BACL|nr:ABC transporter substrate-binding protein [Cohnella kolymensis]KIL36548.1 peptide ABC transporter substrate-binding protein [Cohnella kolymensis]
MTRSFRKGLSFFSVLALLATLLAACSGNKTPESSPSGSASPTPSASASSPSPSASASAEGPVDGGTLTVSTFSDIVAVNPLFVGDTSSGDLETLIFAKLYDLDRNANLTAEPWSLAAELPQISADGLTYTIKLKTTPKWTDGKPVTADDVIFTFDTARNADAGSPLVSQYDKIEKMTKVDDQTVEIKLKQVYAPFQYALYQSIVPAHVLKDVPVKELKEHTYGVDPAKTVTSGPWKWTEWKKGQYIAVESYPEYWGEKKPHIAKVITKIYADQQTEVQALMKGDVDMTQAIPLTQIEAVKKDEDITVILAPGPQYEYVQFNFKDENFPDKYSPFKGQKTRQAIAYALNRQGMVDNVLKGSGALMNSPFLPGSWADPGDAAVNYEYSADKAKALLAEDGWKPGKDGILEKDGHRFSFELQYNSGNSRREGVSAIIQQNLKDVGIEVKPRGIDFATWIDQNITPGKFPAILLGWSLTNPDPDAESIFSSKYFPPAGQNGGWYVNEKLDEMWVKGQQVIDQAERAKIYKEIGKEISIDLPYVFLYQYGLPQGVNTKVVKWAEDDRPESQLAYGYLFHAINWWVDRK